MLQYYGYGIGILPGQMAGEINMEAPMEEATMTNAAKFAKQATFIP